MARKKKQDVKGIVVALAAHRSRQRRIPIGRRRLLLKKVKGADFRVNKHEVELDINYATSGNPIKMIDRVLDAIVDFDRALWEERIRKINEVKSSVMRWMDYLERALPRGQYHEFVTGFLPEEVIDVGTLAPDLIESELDLEALAILAEGERFQDKGIYLRA